MASPKLNEMIGHGFSVGFLSRKLEDEWVYVVVIWKDGWTGRGYDRCLENAAWNAYSDYFGPLPVGW